MVIQNDVFVLVWSGRRRCQARRPYRRTSQSSRCMTTRSVMPAWVKSRHMQCKTACPLYAPKADICSAPATVIMLDGTRVATAQQPQYQVGGFPITPLQMSVLQPYAKMREQQRVRRQPTMETRRRPVYPDPGLANTGF